MIITVPSGTSSQSSRNISNFNAGLQDDSMPMTNQKYNDDKLRRPFNLNPSKLSSRQVPNSNIASSVNENSNQILVESAYKTCPFHCIRTEW